MSLRLLSLAIAFPICVSAAAPVPVDAAVKKVRKKPTLQYESAGIAIPAATADEAKIKEFGPASVLMAKQYLDDGAHTWVREKSCVACHTTGVYMSERPTVTRWLGPPSTEVRDDFVAAVPAADATRDQGPIMSVWRSLGLASWDKHVTGQLSEPTSRSLTWTLKAVRADGSLATYKEVEIPYITTDFELTVQAARAIADAPGWLVDQKDAATLERVQRMQRYLQAHAPINDFELALKLELAASMPSLVPETMKQAAIAMLWRQQQTDGGWSTRRFSDIMKWHAQVDAEVATMLRSEPDADSPGSDAYMTATAIVLLREVGIPASDPRLVRAVDWLKSGQRVSGRWWMKSLFRDTYHYSTYISTAKVLRALAICDQLPHLPQG
jgi:squalene-hopene/tetraprenyl-beta-curcumene cyclase